MARAGMDTLIKQLRRLSSAGTAEYTIGSETYFTDDHLQDILDRYRTLHRRVALYPLPAYTGGAYLYVEYPLPRGLRWLESDAADSGWALRDSAGAVAPAYTVNYEAQVITFAADTGGTTYYLDARSYDLYRAAAETWQFKAGFRAEAVNWQSDNHHVEAALEYEHCVEMAKHYRMLAGISVSRLVRRDEIFE